MKEIKFVYLNHRGETETRTAIPEELWFNRHPAYGYQPGWFLKCFDIDRQATRDFALTHIILEPGEELPFDTYRFRLEA